MVGDCIKQLQVIPTASVDSVVTDPPYGIGFLRAAWDTWTSNKNYAAWVEAWAMECLRILKPGGHLVAFSGTKTYHALAWGVESAGFEIRDMIEWLYVQGMPKMPDIARSKGIDTIPRGLGADLKPAHEPILLARKPLDGTLVENIQRHGTGALFSDACRIGQDTAGWKGGKSQWMMSGLDKTAARDAYASTGRYPANCVSADSEEWFGDFFNVTSRDLSVKIRAHDRDTDVHGRLLPVESKHSAKYPLRSADVEVRYGEKSRKSIVKTVAKNGHPTSKPTPLMAWLIRLVTPPGGWVVDPFCGSGSTLKAAVQNGYLCVGIEKDEEYARLARMRLGEWDEASVEEHLAQGGAVQTSLF